MIQFHVKTDDNEVPTVEFTVADVSYTLAVLNERELDHGDPTLLLFREDEEEAVATVHLDPDAECDDEGHLVVEAADDGLVLIAGVLYDAETLEEA